MSALAKPPAGNGGGEVVLSRQQNGFGAAGEVGFVLHLSNQILASQGFQVVGILYIDLLLSTFTPKTVSNEHNESRSKQSHLPANSNRSGVSG